MSYVAGITDAGEYAELLRASLPHVIHTEAENQRSTNVLEELLRKKKRSPEEKRLAELLTLLIEEFEQKEYDLPRAGPIDILCHLMDANAPAPGGSPGCLRDRQRHFRGAQRKARAIQGAYRQAQRAFPRFPGAVFLARSSAQTDKSSRNAARSISRQAAETQRT